MQNYLEHFFQTLQYPILTTEAADRRSKNIPNFFQTWRAMKRGYANYRLDCITKSLLKLGSYTIPGQLNCLFHRRGVSSPHPYLNDISKLYATENLLEIRSSKNVTAKWNIRSNSCTAHFPEKFCLPGSSFQMNRSIIGNEKRRQPWRIRISKGSH